MPEQGTPAVARLIGNTPMVEIRHIRDGVAPGVRLLAKIEGLNPGGSVKDRAAWNMLRRGLETGARSGRHAQGPDAHRHVEHRSVHRVRAWDLLQRRQR